ncbi:unnamed protein product [Effrenium voratum]|uniref:Uncharacterized protein n=1 Tax=Effrenium voratum TaxID=2562239 RepID=A0AA36JI81_9DINO|nr:unnamed protein product [Effrenium voratum]
MRAKCAKLEAEHARHQAELKTALQAQRAKQQLDLQKLLQEKDVDHRKSLKAQEEQHRDVEQALQAPLCLWKELRQSKKTRHPDPNPSWSRDLRQELQELQQRFADQAIAWADV